MQYLNCFFSQRMYGYSAWDAFISITYFSLFMLTWQELMCIGDVIMKGVLKR